MTSETNRTPTSTRFLFSESAMRHLRHISVAIDMRSEENFSFGSSWWTMVEEVSQIKFFRCSTHGFTTRDLSQYLVGTARTRHKPMWRATWELDRLESLEVDITNAYCPLGCCRNTIFLDNWLACLSLQKLRVVGLRYEAEVREWQGDRDRALELREELSTWELELNPDTDPWGQWKMVVEVQDTSLGNGDNR